MEEKWFFYRFFGYIDFRNFFKNPTDWLWRPLDPFFVFKYFCHPKLTRFPKLAVNTKNGSKNQFEVFLGSSIYPNYLFMQKNLIFLRLLFFHCQFTVFWILCNSNKKIANRTLIRFGLDELLCLDKEPLSVRF